jgi:hypothetical protein
MQQASDCDAVLVHDNDLLAINGIGHGTVSGLLNSSHIAILMSSVTGNPQPRRDDGSPRGVQHRNT